MVINTDKSRQDKGKDKDKGSLVVKSSHLCLGRYLRRSEYENIPKKPLHGCILERKKCNTYIVQLKNLLDIYFWCVFCQILKSETAANKKGWVFFVSFLVQCWKNEFCVMIHLESALRTIFPHPPREELGVSYLVLYLLDKTSNVATV